MRLPGFVGRALAAVGVKSAAMTSLDLYRQMIGGAASRAGAVVTHKTALEVAVVFACARAIAEGMSSIPFRLMRSDGRNRLSATDHPLVELLGVAPNEHQTPVDFFDQIGLHLVLCGNAYVWANRDRKGTPIELLPLEPGKVRPDKGKGVYTVTTDAGRSIDVPASEMWHVRGPSWDGWMGLDGTKLAREAIGLSMAQEQHGAATFANGASIAGILTTDAGLNPEQRRALRESWDQTHGGTVNAGKIAVMSHGMKFVQVASNNTDAQWLESRAAQIEEICRFFRVLPIIIGHADKTSTYASAEAFFDAHVRLTMLPWYRRVEKSADRWLLTDRDRADGLYWKFFPAGLLRANSKDRGEFYRALYGVGAISPNEIREFEDMNPYEGGDQYRVPLNMADPNAPQPPAGA
jgi:HK97 family phage portal protein